MRMPMISWTSSTPSPSSRLSRRSRLRTSFGPDGGLVPMNSTAHRCWRSATRVRWAKAPRSARQSPDGSGTSISASIASSMRSSSSSLDETYQYRDITPAPTSRAIRRMLIASGPSASATAMAARTISARDSPRSRRGGCAPRSRCRWTCPAIRCSRASSRETRPGRGYARVREERPLLVVVSPGLAPLLGSLASRVSGAPSVVTGAPPGRSLPAPSAAQHARSRRRPRKPRPPATPDKRLACSYTVLLWYIVLGRTAYE